MIIPSEAIVIRMLIILPKGRSTQSTLLEMFLPWNWMHLGGQKHPQGFPLIYASWIAYG